MIDSSYGFTVGTKVVLTLTGWYPFLIKYFFNRGKNARFKKLFLVTEQLEAADDDQYKKCMFNS